MTTEENGVTTNTNTPVHLLVQLSIYFAILLGSIVFIAYTQPDIAKFMPLGGNDAIEIANIELGDDGLPVSKGHSGQSGEVAKSRLNVSHNTVARIILYLSTSLAGTILVMLPISWTYMATKRETGFRRNFVRALIVLPICATTIVLLIQDSLALAFGLAALVAAVRFRVQLREAIDGIYIFAAICVGLAAGIGFLGIATIMALFFCFANAVMWQLNYGQNPIDDIKRAKKSAS